MSQNTQTPLNLNPVQLQDVFPVSISAQRAKHIQTADEQPIVQLTGPTILQSEEPSQEDGVQVEMSARIGFPSAPGPFEIEVKIVGVFVQVSELPNGLKLPDYLTQVSLSLLLPFLREYIFALGIQLHIGPLLLPIITPHAIPVTGAEKRPVRRRRPPPPASQE